MSTTKTVGVGARDHETKTVVTRPTVTRPTWKYQAECSCGWRGPDRTSAVVAADDESGHMSAAEGE